MARSTLSANNANCELQVPGAMPRSVTFRSFFFDPGHKTNLGAESIGEREAGAVEAILSTAGVATGPVDARVLPEPHKLGPLLPLTSGRVEFSPHTIPFSLPQEGIQIK